MQILIFIILTVLLVLLIKTLHSFQAKKTQESVQQSTPLPPLELKPPPSKDADLKPAPAPKAQVTEKADTWQNRLKTLRAAGEFQQALAISSQHYPKTQAFQQSLVTLRAQIKSHQQTQSDPSKALAALYHVAASSDLFRNGSAQSKNLKQANLPAILTQLGKTALPYAEIGYENLAMLNKGDIKHFVQAWEEPQAHCHTEDFLGDSWEQLVLTNSDKQ